jgi:hypothetical protein
MPAHQGAAQAAAVVVVNPHQLEGQFLWPGFPHQDVGFNPMQS